MARSHVRAVKGSSSAQFRMARRSFVDTATHVSLAWPAARSVLLVGLIDVARLA